MKAYILRITALWLSFIASFPTLAFDDDICSSLNSNSDFAVSFEIDNARLLETVWIEKKGGGKEKDIAIWTDNLSVGDPNPVIIRADNDDEYIIEVGQDYHVWLTYISSGLNDKKGVVTYYLWVDGQWREISNSDADLSTLHSVNIVIDEENVDDLECADDITQPPFPEYSLDAKYEFGTAQCNLTHSASCSISFTQNYDIAPLVFVMPTIDINFSDEDKPATLYIASELTADSTSVKVKKHTLDLSQMDNDAPITEVSYLIIEPGVANFNSHKVIAGYTVTDAENSKNDSGSSTEVEFEDFGWDDDLDTPVVLHQIQTRNNGNKWMTSGKTTRNDEDSVRLFLELSASKDRHHNYVEEKIAFIATESVSNLTVGNYDVAFARGFKNANQTGTDPMNDACTKAYADISTLTRVDGIIGKKQERRGGHGGWVRRCEIKDDNQVSFVIDEDFRDRTHLREEIGYFAFESVNTDIDLCTYFPEPAQSWMSGSNLNMQNPGSTISGWSQSFIDNNLSNGELTVGFDSVTYHAGLDGACDVGSCSSGGDRVETPFAISPSFNSTTDLSIELANYDTVCDGSSCSYSENGDGSVTLNILSSLRSLSVAGNGISFIVNFTDLGGTYGTEVETYYSEGVVETLLSANGQYTFGSMSFSSSGGQLSTESDVTIYIVDSFITNNTITMNDLGGNKDLIIFGPTADISFSTALGDFSAQILGDNVSFNNPVTVRGAVTANVLNMPTSNINIIGEGACLSPPPSSTYRIELTPVSGIALTCEALPLTATVYKDDVIDTSYSGNITLSTDDGQSDQNKNAVKGVAEFSLSVTQASSISAEVSTTIDTTTYTDDGSYDFVPYKFDVPDQYLIAAKSDTVNASVLACNSGSVVELGYTGAPSVTSELIQPSLGTGTLTYAPAFSNGTSSSSIEFSDSGQLTVTLSDDDFNCDDYDECPIEGGDELTGSFTVNVRPWTFAICSDNDNADDVGGTATGGVGYQAAGTTFATTVKPIIWQDVSTTDPIETSSYCDAAVTQNFFVSDAPSATVEMTHQVDTPSGGIDGNLSGTLTQNHNNKSGDGDHYDFADLSWDEVGSIRLLTGTQSTYLGMDINQGYRNVGRFYPAFFKVIDTRWDYPESQSHIYMGQPFDGLEFDVEALNNSSEAVQNYPLFTTELKAKFNLFENSTFDSRFVSPAFGNGSWVVSSNRSVGTFTNNVANDCSDSICWNKQSDFGPDGPFNAAEDIEDSNITLDGTGTDPIVYTTDGEILTDQPDIRFGRINLKDVGGNQGNEITVPLTVEYWNGSRFITNTDDSSTTFDGDDYCQQVIWSDLSGNASLSEDGTVSLGESRSLLATQSTSTREQIRFWLTLHSTDGTNSESDSCGGSDNGLSWLRYNWDGEDDDEEDPSTVVTFGIHRGNDRVIFRGETGLTGQ